MMKNLPEVFRVTAHSQHVGVGSTFIALKGFKEHGVSYIPEAIKKGATTIVIEEGAPALSDSVKQLIADYNITIVFVPNGRRALAELSAKAYDFPAKKLKFIGITGTKGKTTTTLLVEHILRSQGITSAVISTVHNRIGDQIFPRSLTTPQPDYLHAFFDLCVKEEVEWVIMEVAAQAISLHRIEGLTFDRIAFTNFSQEHGEFYSTMDDYLRAKIGLLRYAHDSCLTFFNADDEYLKKFLPAHSIQCSVKKFYDYYGTLIETSISGMRFKIYSPDESEEGFISSLLGIYNVANITLACAISKSLGISLKKSLESLSQFPGIKGRLTKFQFPHGAWIFIDFAHNPSSFEAIFSLMRPLTDHLIVVFGAGGGRDAARRPIMGKIAYTFADHIILTSDNPRNEDPHEIIADIVKDIPDLSSVHIELDRKKAIHYAYAISHYNSIILLLGKGADEYELVKEQKKFFSERHIIEELSNKTVHDILTTIAFSVKQK